MAMFDFRAFNIPKAEVRNMLIWRQQDAIRNSIQQVDQTYFTEKELHGKNQNDIKDLLMVHKDVNWDNFPVHLKRGSCCIKVINDTNSLRPQWVIDKETPVFTENREYVESRIFL